MPSHTYWRVDKETWIIEPRSHEQKLSSPSQAQYCTTNSSGYIFILSLVSRDIVIFSVVSKMLSYFLLYLQWNMHNFARFSCKYAFEAQMCNPRDVLFWFLKSENFVKLLLLWLEIDKTARGYSTGTWWSCTLTTPLRSFSPSSRPRTSIPFRRH